MNERINEWAIGQKTLCLSHYCRHILQSLVIKLRLCNLLKMCRLKM